MRNAARRYERGELDAVRLEGHRADQQRCCLPEQGELPCPDCFFDGGESDGER
jgi:hypothetical protein